MINPNQKHQVYIQSLYHGRFILKTQPTNAWSSCKKENEILEYVNEYPTY